jgi:hypothetical protein
VSYSLDREKDDAARAVKMRWRIMSVLPAARYEMHTLLSLVDIVVDDRCATAAVETGVQSRLLVNPDFIEEHCATNERLFMLIMHELYHVILGHTRLWPRATDVDNIVLDAVINSLLCRQFDEAVYTELLTSLYCAETFPERLLRPPVGWHQSRCVPADDAGPQEQAVMELLYGSGPAAGDTPSMVTYDDVRALFDAEPEADPLGGEALEPLLLGDHTGPGGSGPADDAAVRDPVVTAVLGRTVAGWPNAALGRAAGLGRDELQELLFGKPMPRRASFLQGLRALLRRAGIVAGRRGGALSWQVQPRALERVTFEPNAGDRTAAARGELWGADPLLYTDAVARPACRLMPRTSAFVYLDVSGSMFGDLPWLLSALRPLVRNGDIEVRLFSTMVAEVTRQDLLAGRIRTTGGTDIRCVYDHLLALPPAKTPRKAVILTDGYTGSPTIEQAQAARRRGVEFYVGVIQGGNARDLKPYVAATVRLPALR